MVVGIYKVRVQEEVFKRKEIAEKSVFYCMHNGPYRLKNGFITFNFYETSILNIAILVFY